MQYSPYMTSVSFPIAHHLSFRNPPGSVFSVTLLLPQDDTSDVIPRRTYLRHTYHLSAARNFRLIPQPTHPHFGTLVPCPHHLPMHPHFSVSHVILLPCDWRGERATQEHARQTGACRLPSSPPRPAPPRLIPTHLFHVKQRRMIIPALIAGPIFTLLRKP